MDIVVIVVYKQFVQKDVHTFYLVHVPTEC
jgi:hypothetical protein